MNNNIYKKKLKKKQQQQQRCYPCTHNETFCWFRLFGVEVIMEIPKANWIKVHVCLPCRGKQNI